MSTASLTAFLWEALTRPPHEVPFLEDRSNRHWSEQDVANLLEAATRDHPADIRLWEQLADHWLEKGNFVRAAATLDAAIAHFPDAAGLYARRADALHTIDPERSARDGEQALALGAPPPPRPLEVAIVTPTAKDKVTAIYADITDMMAYLSLNVSMSGIQRVTANMLRCAMDRTSPNARDVVPVVPDHINKIVYTADPALVRELIDLVEFHRPDREQLDRLLLAIQASLRTIEPEPGSLMLIAGAFWIVNSYDLLKALRQRGVIVTIFIHDLIQINNPEVVHKEATESFRRCLLDVADIANFFTTNSAFVARNLRRFLKHEAGIDTPVYPVPLATEMQPSPIEPWEEESLRAEFGENGYVLCVCTIEIRKNHIYLIRIWQELLRSGRTDIPKLVLIGKWGWEIEHLRSLLDRTNNLNDMVRVMTGVSDSQLATLYRNCRFTVYPSFAEGWGLPIGESLVFGKPCISAGVTSMPEVGGPLVRYVDPLDVTTGLSAVKQILDDPADLAGWTDQIAREFRPKSWAQFTEQLLGVSRALALQTAAPPAAFSRIPPGKFALVGSTDVRLAGDSAARIYTARMAREHGWLELEDTGAWSIKPLATLRFIAVGCAPGDKLVVSICLRGEIGQAPVFCRLRTNSAMTDFQPLGGAPSPHRVQAEVGADHAVEVAILVKGGPLHAHGHAVYTCFSGLGYYREHDAEEKLALMEAMTFRP